MPSVRTDILSAELIKLPTYRAIRLAGDGSVEGIEIIEATTDTDARTLAAMMVNGHGLDLWESTRFIESYPALSPRVLGAKA